MKQRISTALETLEALYFLTQSLEGQAIRDISNIRQNIEKFTENSQVTYVGKETDRKWEEGDEISVLEFAATEYGRKGKVVASEDVKAQISIIGINKCARESRFDRKNFIRKLVRGVPVKRSSYNEFVRWLSGHDSRVRSQ
jgi:hypothetical protein